MAVTHTLLTEGNDLSNGTSYATASISPSTDKLLIVDVAADPAAANDNVQPTLSGCGVTWVAVASLVGVGGDGGTWARQTMFRSMGTPTTGVLTISFSATQEAVRWSVCEKGNVDTGGTNGSAAVVQSATGTSTSTTCTVTLSAFGNANNATHGAFHREGEATGVTQAPGTGFTEETELESDLTGGYYGYLHTIYRNDNDTTVDSTASDALDGTSGIAIEIKESAGTTNLVVQDAAQAVAADSPALTQANTLVLADAAQAVAADNISLTQQNTLAINEALQSVAADNVVLELSTVLILSDAAQAVTADSPSLIQQNTLAINEALQSVAVDSPALVQANSLVVAESLHGNTAESPVLNIGLSLIVSESNHAQTVETPALTQANILTIQECLQAVNVDNAVLTQANIIAVSDALHSNIVDTITLSLDTGAITPIERIFLIGSEDRTFIIADEDRIYLVKAEDRIFKVAGEDRTCLIKAEDHVFKITE